MAQREEDVPARHKTVLLALDMPKQANPHYSMQFVLMSCSFCFASPQKSLGHSISPDRCVRGEGCGEFQHRGPPDQVQQGHARDGTHVAIVVLEAMEAQWWGHSQQRIMNIIIHIIMYIYGDAVVGP